MIYFLSTVYRRCSLEGIVALFVLFCPLITAFIVGCAQSKERRINTECLSTGPHQSPTAHHDLYCTQLQESAVQSIAWS